MRWGAAGEPSRQGQLAGGWHTACPTLPPPRRRRGILNVRRLGAWAVATYSAVFGFIVATGLALDALQLYRRWAGRGAGAADGSAGAAAGTDNGHAGGSCRHAMAADKSSSVQEEVGPYKPGGSQASSV